MPNGSDSLIQRHFANLRHIRDTFRIDPRAPRGTAQIAPWLSQVVHLVHPAIEGAFGSSNPQIRTFPDPAVATDLFISVPPNQSWRVDALTFLFTTDANVANRIVTLGLDDTLISFFLVPPITEQLASLGIRYSYGRSFGYQHELLAQKTHGLPDAVLPAGLRIRTIINSIQVGDQISEIALLVDVLTR